MKEITVECAIAADEKTVWEFWTNPQHITQWNFATDEWCCPNAINELEAEGKFSWRMEAKDGSMGFDYSGTYQEIVPYFKIGLTLDDGRAVIIEFKNKNGITTVSETFEPDENDPDLQRQGWQAILNNFKKYVELQT